MVKLNKMQTTPESELEEFQLENFSPWYGLLGEQFKEATRGQQNTPHSLYACSKFLGK